ncbi:hypothetical protein GCM10028857_14580 [Salinarchaeum chitinilyticum]
MADGKVVLDRAFGVEEPPGSRVSLFACVDSSRPGGYKYSFQQFGPETGETLLRYDNAHEHPDAGWHHRHVGGDDPVPIEFDGLEDHLRRFRQEVTAADD